jgi:hypothetical protein
MTVAATIVVHFGDDVAEDNRFALVMLDDALNVDAAGEVITSFAPGDQIHFLVQHDPALRIARVASSDGTVAAQPDKDYQMEQQLTYLVADEDQELTAIPSGPITKAAYGRTAAGWTVQGRKLRITGGGPVIYDIEYRARMKSYCLHAPNVVLAEDATWPVVVGIYLENVA